MYKSISHTTSFLNRTDYNKSIESIPDLPEDDHYKIYKDSTIDYLMRRAFMKLYLILTQDEKDSIDDCYYIFKFNEPVIINGNIEVEIVYSQFEKTTNIRFKHSLKEEVHIPEETSDSDLFLELLFGNLLKQFYFSVDKEDRYLVNFPGNTINKNDSDDFYTLFSYLEYNIYNG